MLNKDVCRPGWSWDSSICLGLCTGSCSCLLLQDDCLSALQYWAPSMPDMQCLPCAVCAQSSRGKGILQQSDASILTGGHDVQSWPCAGPDTALWNGHLCSSLHGARHKALQRVPALCPLQPGQQQVPSAAPRKGRKGSAEQPVGAGCIVSGACLPALLPLPANPYQEQACLSCRCGRGTLEQNVACIWLQGHDDSVAQAGRVQGPSQRAGMVTSVVASMGLPCRRPRRSARHRGHHARGEPAVSEPPARCLLPGRQGEGPQLQPRLQRLEHAPGGRLASMKLLVFISASAEAGLWGA